MTKVSQKKFAALIGVTPKAVRDAINNGRLSSASVVRLEGNKGYEIDFEIASREWVERNRRQDLGVVDKKNSIPFASRKPDPATPSPPPGSPLARGLAATAPLIDSDGNEIPDNIESQRVLNYYKAQKAEREAKLADGSLVLIDDVAEIVSQEYQNVRKGFLACGSDLAPQLAMLTSTAEIKSLIDDYIAEVLTGLVSDDNYRNVKRTA